MQRWLLYALGGGLGHLTRAIALARAANRRGHRVEIVSNSPFLADICALPPARGPGVTIVAIDPSHDRDAVAVRVSSHLRSARFDCLVVDTFPRGLGGELARLLPAIDLPKVLVHRDIEPAYVADRALDSFVATYHLVLLPGERGPLAAGSRPPRIETAHWLLRDGSELLGRLEARTRLGAAEGVPLVVVLGTGNAEEARAMAYRARGLAHALGSAATVRFVAPPSACRDPTDGPAATEGAMAPPWHWPLLELLAGVDVLVGSAGYNTVAEAEATSTPLVSLVRERRYDRQARRALGASHVVVAGDDGPTLASAVRRRLALRRDGPIAYPNGAHDAAETIERLVGWG